MFSNTRIEVLSLVGHFILAGLLAAAYVFLRIHGIDDETMRFALIASVTYFFGAASTSLMSAKTQQIAQQAQPQQPTDQATQAPAAAPQDNTPKNGGVGI